MTLIKEQSFANEPYVFPKDSGVTDIWFPASAGRWTTKAAAQQTEGRLLQLHGREPRGAAPPLHIHHDADEAFFVLAGQLTIFVGDQRIEVEAGDYVLGPKGIPHTFVVRSERAEVFVTFTPAGTEGPSGFGLDGFFREIGIPVVPGEAAPEPVPPDPEEFARRAALYGIEIVGPPPILG
jgi:mannose-6-phosphate isomerase-like protein (cupin superfamily)